MTVEMCQVRTFHSIVLSTLLVDLKLVFEVVILLLFSHSKHKGDIKFLIKIAQKDCTKIFQAYKLFHGLWNFFPVAVKINTELSLTECPWIISLFLAHRRKLKDEYRRIFKYLNYKIII